MIVKNVSNLKYFFPLFLTIAILPCFVFAAIVPPCGTINTPCQLKDLETLFQNIMNFLLKTVMAPLAIMALAFAGFKYMTARGNPSEIAKVHDILGSVLLGIIIALAAYAVIETIFVVLTRAGKITSITGT